MAAAYDIYVSKSGEEMLLPDGKFYSIKGRHVALQLNGYDESSFTSDMVPQDKKSQFIFLCSIVDEKGRTVSPFSEVGIYAYAVGLIYFIFGFFPLGARTLNIALSLFGAYFLFDIGRRQLGVLRANLFLLVALFLPTQVIYSITLSKDFMRMFVVCLMLWLIYGGVAWLRRAEV